MFDISNRLSLQMGILEGADVPDIFGDSISCFCVWDEDYYTLDPSSGGVTSLVNLGGSPFVVHLPSNLAKYTVDTDPDATRWLKPIAADLAGDVLRLHPDDEAYIDTHAPGIITLESYRAVADHSLSGNSPPAHWGFVAGRAHTDTGAIWRNLENTDPYNPQFDYWGYKYITAAWSPASDGKWIYLGPPHGSIFNATYNPADRLSFSPGYFAGQDLVISRWFSANGFRMMLNGKLITVHSISRHEANGGYVAGGLDKEQAEIAADHSIKAYTERIAVTYPTVTPGDGNLGIQFAFGDGKCDYMGLFSATKGDTWVKAAHSLLLNAKPVS